MLSKTSQIKKKLEDVHSDLYQFVTEYQNSVNDKDPTNMTGKLNVLLSQSEYKDGKSVIIEYVQPTILEIIEKVKNEFKKNPNIRDQIKRCRDLLKLLCLISKNQTTCYTDFNTFMIDIGKIYLAYSTDELKSFNSDELYQIFMYIDICLFDMRNYRKQYGSQFSNKMLISYIAKNKTISNILKQENPEYYEETSSTKVTTIWQIIALIILVILIILATIFQFLITILPTLYFIIFIFLWIKFRKTKKFWKIALWLFFIPYLRN